MVINCLLLSLLCLNYTYFILLENISNKNNFN